MTRYMTGVLAIGLIAVSPLASAQDNQLEGEVVSVDVPDRTLTVHMADTNRNRTFTADDDTNVRVYGGFDRGVDGLRDLAEGDEVTLVLSGDPGRERITQIEQTSVSQASRMDTQQQRQMTGQDTRGQQTMAGQRQDRQQSQQYLPSTDTPVSYYVLATGLLLLAFAAALRIARKSAQQRARGK